MLSALNKSIAFDSASRPLPLALVDGAHRPPNTSSEMIIYHCSLLPHRRCTLEKVGTEDYRRLISTSKGLKLVIE